MSLFCALICSPLVLFIERQVGVSCRVFPGIICINKSDFYSTEYNTNSLSCCGFLTMNDIQLFFS